MLYGFFGGVRPAGHKEATRGAVTRPLETGAVPECDPRPAQRVAPDTAPAAASPAAICAAIRWAGLPPLPKGAETLIINGIEAEPYCTADCRLMLERAEAVLTGARLLARALGAGRTVIAVGGDKYDCASALRALLPLRGGDVQVRVCRVRYPLEVGPLLPKTVTGGRDAACAVLGVDYAAAVSDAVYDGIPAWRRIVTVTGGAIKTPQNLLVPLGTPVSELISAAGGFGEHPERVLLGGGMRGVAQSDLTAPITWATSAVVAMTRRETRDANRPEGACLRCGRCIAACPARLKPLYLRQYAREEKPEQLARLRIAACTECGACAYVCPAHVPLVEYIRGGKALAAAAEGGGVSHE